MALSTVVAPHNKLGISLKAAKAYIGSLQLDIAKTNGYDLLDHYIRPSVGDKSVCEILQEKGGGGVGKARVFWLHAQSEKVGSTLAGLESYINRSGFSVDELLFWIDFFTLRQNASKEFTPPEVEAVIGLIKHTVMMVSPWDAPATLTRAWCVFEVVCTHKTKARFEAHLSPEDAHAFVQSVRCSSASFFASFEGLDIKNFTARDENDKAMILDQVNKLDGGLHGTNVRVVETLKNSFIPVLLAEIEAQPSDDVLMHNVGMVLYRNGDLRLAETLFRRQLALAEEKYGPESNEVAHACNNLAGVFFDTGDLASCEKFFRRALNTDEKTLGPEHSTVGVRCRSLGEVLQEKGDIVQAKGMYLRALRIYEKTLGAEDPEIAKVYNNLGNISREKCDLANSEELLCKSLRMNEKLHGLEGFHVAWTCNDLGLLFQEKGDLAVAEQNFHRSLATREKILGLDHPLVAEVHMNLGKFLKEKKCDNIDAKQHFQLSFRIREKALGPWHNKTKQVQKLWKECDALCVYPGFTEPADVCTAENIKAPNGCCCNVS